MHDTDPEGQTVLVAEDADEADAAAETATETMALVSSGAREHTLLGPEGKRRKKSYKLLPRGSAIGRYVVINHLGAGGMGVVYAAYDPELDRRVAIKLLQTDDEAPDDGTTGHARLLREAQAMARLTHPNVIAVYDVGTYERAVFVAMEHVAGRTVNEHFTKQWEAGTPDWRQTVALFVAAGRGLAAAHAAGIVHRDFKPDNVMVADDGRVLVLDFGLARPTGDASPLSSDGSVSDSEIPIATSQGALASGQRSAQLTKTGTVMGTPAYMSPEQMTGRPTDAPTDQFSFCVALYQALYRERPFAGSSFADLTSSVLRGRVREAPRGSNVPLWLRRALLRGLARKPEDRYPSMNALLAAVQHDPAARRRNVLLGAGAATLLAAAAVMGSRIANKDDPCRDAAAAMRTVWTPARTTAIHAAFSQIGKAYADDAYDLLVVVLQTYADGWIEQRQDACRAARVRGEQSDEVMGLRMACLDRRLQRFDALVEMLAGADAEMATQSLSAVHDLPRLEPCADVEALTRDVAPPEDPETAKEVEAIRLGFERAIALADGGRIADAEGQMDALLLRAERTEYSPIIAEASGTLAELHANIGNATKARDLAKRAVLVAEAAGSDRLVVVNLLTLANLEGMALNEFALAVEHADLAQAVIARRGDLIGDRIRLSNIKGIIARSLDDWDAAIEHFEHTWALRVEAGQADEPLALNTLNALGMAYIHQDQLDKGAEITQQAVEMGTELLGPAHPNIGVTLALQGRLSGARNRREDALAFYQRARSNFVNSLGAEHSNVAAMDNALGLTYAAMGRTDDALAAYESALRGITTTRGAEHLDAAAAHANLGALLVSMDRPEEALEHQQAALAIKRKRLGDEHREVGYSYDQLADAYLAMDRYDDAIAYYEKSVAIFEAADGKDSRDTAYGLAGIGLVHLAQGHPQRALPMLERAVAIGPAADADPQAAARAKFALAQALSEPRDAARALALARAAEAGWSESPDANAGAIARVQAWLAEHDVP